MRGLFPRIPEKLFALQGVIFQTLTFITSVKTNKNQRKQYDKEKRLNNLHRDSLAPDFLEVEVMPIDTTTERLITIAEAAKKHGKHTNTVRNWAIRGVFGVRLETVMVGHGRHTSEEALERFFERVTAASAGGSAPVAHTPQQRRKALAAAERELAEAGI